MANLNEASIERLWLMFFRHFGRNHGMSLVRELLEKKDNHE